MTYAEQGSVRTVVARPRLALGPVDRERAAGYLLLSPGLIALAVLVGVPVVQGIALSFTDRYLLEPKTGAFVGLQNYATFIQSPSFFHYITNTFIWSIGSLTGILSLGMALALLLNRNLRFRSVYRALALIPWVMPMVAAGLVWRWIFDGAYGILNYSLLQLGIVHQYVTFLADLTFTWPSVLIVSWWKGYPFVYAVLLAGLQGISKEMYEAAAIDGATGWKAFLNVTLPQLRPVLFVLVLLESIWTTNDFTSIWVLTQGGPPPDYTMTLTQLVYVNTQVFDRTAYGAAIAVFLMIWMMLLTVLYVRRVNSDITR
ncbi:MAG: sugar ABC transporter permease [Chloroflexota bacterium]|nr:sugar ABC transporter permease [Chloroflexota bacterium]